MAPVAVDEVMKEEPQMEDEGQGVEEATPAVKKQKTTEAAEVDDVAPSKDNVEVAATIDSPVPVVEEPKKRKKPGPKPKRKKPGPKPKNREKSPDSDETNGRGEDNGLCDDCAKLLVCVEMEALKAMLPDSNANLAALLTDCNKDVERAANLYFLRPALVQKNYPEGSGCNHLRK